MTSVNAKHEALLDELLKDYTSPQDILGEHGLLKQLTKTVLETALDEELTEHLGHDKHSPSETGNVRSYALLMFLGVVVVTALALLGVR